MLREDGSEHAGPIHPQVMSILAEAQLPRLISVAMVAMVMVAKVVRFELNENTLTIRLNGDEYVHEHTVRSDETLKYLRLAMGGGHPITFHMVGRL